LRSVQEIHTALSTFSAIFLFKCGWVTHAKVVFSRSQWICPQIGILDMLHAISLVVTSLLLWASMFICYTVYLLYTITLSFVITVSHKRVDQ